MDGKVYDETGSDGLSEVEKFNLVINIL